MGDQIINQTIERSDNRLTQDLSPNNRREQLYRIVGVLFSAAAISILIWKIYQQATSVGGLFLNLSPPRLLLAIVFLAFHFAIAGTIWVALLKGLRVDRSTIELLGVWAYTQPARYLPGKFWHIGGRFLMCEQRGISREATVGSLYLENLLAIIAAITWVMVTVLPDLLSNYWWGYTFAMLAVGLIFMIMIRPRTTGHLLSIRGQPSSAILSFKRRSLMILGLVWIMNWMILGAALDSLMRGIGVSSPLGPVYLSGTFAVAWLFSGLFVVVPQGLGVREGVFALLLSPWIPIGSASLVAIAFRGCTLAAELLLVAIIFGTNVYRRIRTGMPKA